MRRSTSLTVHGELALKAVINPEALRHVNLLAHDIIRFMLNSNYWLANPILDCCSSRRTDNVILVEVVPG